MAAGHPASHGAGSHGHDHGNDHGHADHPHGWRRYVYSTNHKDIGMMYLIFAIMAGIIGGYLSVMMRAELAEPGMQIGRVESSRMKLMISITAAWVLKTSATSLSRSAMVPP